MRKIKIGDYYHIYSRGVDNQCIFKENLDYLRFMGSIFQFNTKLNVEYNKYKQIKREKLVKIYCFTLMPNHFHMILKEIREGGISLFMQKLLSGYSLYFNKKYERKGRLMETTFKDKLIDEDDYFKYLTRYIWNNPLKLKHPEYQSIDLKNGHFILSNDDRIFLKKYPYKYFSNKAKLSLLASEVKPPRF